MLASLLAAIRLALRGFSCRLHRHDVRARSRVIRLQSRRVVRALRLTQPYCATCLQPIGLARWSPVPRIATDAQDQEDTP